MRTATFSRFIMRLCEGLYALLFGLGLLAMRGSRLPFGSVALDHLWEGVCLAVSGLGFALRVWTVGHTPAGTSGRNTREQVAETLNTTGLYSVVRHPLYLGNFFMGLGIALFPRSWWLVGIYSMAFWLYYERIMFAEEAFLEERFGDQFVAWARRTPAFLPRPRQYIPAELTFSWRSVLRREYSGLLVVLTAMFLLEVAGDFSTSGRLRLDPYWVALLGAGAVVWAVLRTLRKRTKVLDAPGR